MICLAVVFVSVFNYYSVASLTDEGSRAYVIDIIENFAFCRKYLRDIG
jgi:hypothetical protein